MPIITFTEEQHTQLMNNLHDAREIAVSLPNSREAQMVLIKIDEALLWLAAVHIESPNE